MFMNGGDAVSAAGTGLTASGGTASVNFAVQADMETPSSAVLSIPPSVLIHHPCIPKAWGMFTVTAGTPVLTVGYGISSTIGDGGAGLFTINWTTNFSSANYGVVVTCDRTAVPGGTSANTVPASRAVGSIQIQLYSEASNFLNSGFDSPQFTVVAWGDQ